MDIYSLLVILTAVRYFTDGLAANTCYSPQYLELGKTGTVNCVFEQGFFGIYWYNTTDYVNNKPVIHYNGVKIINDGYESGEFDVHPNGSLIINKVSPKHERVFTVAYIRTKQERSIITEIQLIIFVKPKLNFPDINACGNTTYFCFSKHKLPLHCTVRDVRPNVTLKWIMRQLNGDREIESEMEITSADVGFTTRAILTDILQDSPILVLLACKASSPPILMEKKESFVLYQRKTVDLSQKAPQLTPVDRNSEILLNCTDGPIDFIVWQKINSVNESESEVLLYAVFVGEAHLNESLASYASLNLNGSLKINSADKRHEGTYICIFGKGWTAYDLKIIDDHSPTEKGDVPVTRNNHMWFGFAIFIAIVIFSVIFFGILILIKFLKCRREYVEIAANDEEMTKIFHRKPSDGASTLDLKRLFLRQMKETYKDWYDAIQPIPYIKEKLYCVDKVFVEGGIEFLESKEGIGGHSVWATLESYEDVFNAFQVSSSRRILEGEPGYGNSTVTLQFAYDWCNSKPTSILKDVEILILLRLRQLGGVSSIYKAIKRFILPRDTRISETDIKHILCHSESVVILLDGFDEYPDRDSTITPEVISIIARQMFQDFEVITTTRSSFLPKKYPPLTKRIRLTGFNEKARRQYIRKAVVGDNDESVKKIEGYLENNHVLRDLCQVPLLFVIFAHMTHENDKFRNLHSVTSFFRYMISCFHTHMKNKMEDEKLRKYELFEVDHCDLDKLAFEAFSGNNKKIVWDKDEMCRLLKPEFYEQYVRIGILVEEESVDFIDDPGTPITEHVQYKTKVRFYHKLFCEWYAAHYLAEFLQQNAAVNLHEFLRNLDPLDVQYLYRFTCGIKAESGEKLIEYLQSIEGGDTVAILCILEQRWSNMDNIKKTICKICDEGVIISDHDTLLLQRSSLKLLEVATENEIPIELVDLYNCFQEVDLSTETIKINSGLALTSRVPVKVLRIRLYNRQMTEDEAISILKFSSMCSSLQKLVFGGSIPPLSFKVDPFLLKLRSRNVTVQWRLFKEHPVYILNPEIGRWEKQGSHEEPTETEFEEMHAIFTENLKNKDENYYKDQNKKKRETLRKEAKKRRQRNSE